MGRKMFLPERYVTEFSNVMNVYIPAGRSTAAAGNYMDVVTNSLSSQFNATYTAVTAPGAAYSFWGTLVQGNTITQAPIGYTNFAGLYLRYRVHSFRITVTVMPANSADVTAVVLAPLGNEEIPSAGAASVNTHVMMSQPSSVMKICTPFADPRENTVSIQHNCWDFLGQRKEQYLAQQPDVISGYPVVPLFAGLFLQQMNGSNNAAAIAVQITLEQVVELCDLNNPIN
jgi:hypothetical protein